MRRVIATAAVIAFSLAAFSAADAAPCKDLKGKFIKCPAMAPMKPMPMKPLKCKDPKGKFTKCGMPGAKPIG